MNAKNLFKKSIAGVCSIAALGLALTLDNQPAAAHRDRTQEPILRQPTIHL